MPDEPGKLTILDDTWELLRLIGRGGTGEVWEASNRLTKRRAALKISHPGKVSEHLLRREMNALKGIRHSRLASVHEISRTSDDRTYIVYEFVDGPSIYDVLRSEGRFPPDRAREIILGVLDGLDALHHAGLIHRDLTPENIILRDGISPVLIDFGAVGLIGSDRGGTLDPVTGQLTTVVGDFAGKLTYMSPEQVSGSPQTAATDLWTAALLLLEMLTGDPPIRGASAVETFALIVDAEFDLDGVPAEFHPFLRACLAPNTDQRPRSARDAALLLLSGAAAPLRADPAGRAAQPAGPYGTFLVIAFFALAAVIAALGLSWTAPATDPSQSDGYWLQLVDALAGANANALLLIAGGVVVALAGRAVARNITVRSRNRRAEVRLRATSIINDPAPRAALTGPILTEIEHYQSLARSAGDRMMTLTLIALAKTWMDADSDEDAHRAMATFIDVHDKLSRRLSPWWLDYDRAIGRGVSATTLIGSAVAIVSGVNGLL